MARRVRLNPSEARKFSEIINEAILDSPNAKRDLAKVRKELEQEFKVARATAKRLRDRKTYLKSEAEKNIRESRKLMQRAQKLDAADRETEADAAADKAADLQIKAQAMMGEFKTGSIQSKKLVDRLKEIQSDINRVDKLISALDAKEDRRRRGIPDPTSPGQERSKREKAQKAAFAELVIFYKDRVKPHVRKYPTAAGDVEFVEGQLPVIRRKLNRGDDVSFELRRVDKAVRDLHKLVKPRKTKRIFADVRRGLEAFVEETARLAKEGAPQKEVDQVLFELDEFSRSFSAKEKADFTMDERREMSRSIRKIQKALRMMKGRRKKNPCIGLHFHGKDADELLAAMEASAKRQKLEAKKKLPNPMHKVPKKATKAQVRSTVSKNIALLMEEGYPQKQAVAISLTRAREDAPGKVESIYGPSPNPSTNPYLGDAVTKAKAKMAKKRGRSTPPPLPAKMKKKKMSSRKVSNPKKSAKKNPRLTPAQKDRRDRIYRMMRQGYEPSFADQAFLEAIGSQHRVRREYADIEIEKPRKQKGKGRIRVSLEGSRRENPLNPTRGHGSDKIVPAVLRWYGKNGYYNKDIGEAAVDASVNPAIFLKFLYINLGKSIMKLPWKNFENLRHELERNNVRIGDSAVRDLKFVSEVYYSFFMKPNHGKLPSPTTDNYFHKAEKIIERLYPKIEDKAPMYGREFAILGNTLSVLSRLYKDSQDPSRIPSSLSDIKHHVLAYDLLGGDPEEFFAHKFQESFVRASNAAARHKRKSNPKSKRTAKKTAKKKTAKKTTRRKAPLAKTLISKCQKLWDHYCERPGKKRLKEVLEHLEKMKESSAKTVKEERARCLRAANKEAKRLNMKK